MINATSGDTILDAVASSSCAGLRGRTCADPGGGPAASPVAPRSQDSPTDDPSARGDGATAPPRPTDPRGRTPTSPRIARAAAPPAPDGHPAHPGAPEHCSTDTAARGAGRTGSVWRGRVRRSQRSSRRPGNPHRLPGHEASFDTAHAPRCCAERRGSGNVPRALALIQHFNVEGALPLISVATAGKPVLVLRLPTSAAGRRGSPGSACDLSARLSPSPGALGSECGLQVVWPAARADGAMSSG